MLQLKLAHVWSQRRYHFVRAMHYSLYVLGARHYHLCYYIKCFSVSSNDLWPVSSSRTLERRGNTYTQRKPPPNSQNSSTQPSFYQYFIFHGGTGRNHKLFFWRALLSSKRWSTSTTPNSVTNCMLIIIITYLYSVFKRIILSCSPFYFSFTCT